MSLNDWDIFQVRNNESLVVSQRRTNSRPVRGEIQTSSFSAYRTGFKKSNLYLQAAPSPKSL